MTTPNKYGIDFQKISASTENHQREWQLGMDIARLELDSSTIKREFIEWAVKSNFEDVQHFALLPDWRYITIGRMAWLLNNGADIPESSNRFMQAQIAKLRSIQSDQLEETEELSIDAKRTIQYVNLYSRIDVLRMKHIDDLDLLEEEIRKLFNNNQTSMFIIRKVYQHFKENLNESLKERDNPEVDAWIEPLVVVVNVLAACTGNAKTINVMRRKVNNKATKAAKNASVKLLDTETNIVGLNPANLVGNTHALVYNCKNRKVMLYTAKTGEKLSIKGTYITGYDDTRSFGKTLRKPKDVFSKILHNPTVDRIDRVLNDYVKGKKHTTNGKLNKETMLVKVFK